MDPQNPTAPYPTLDPKTERKEKFRAARELLKQERREFRKRLNAKGNLYPTLILIAICVAVTSLEFFIYGSHPTPMDLFRAGGQEGGATAHSDFWRLLSAAFLHVDVAHIVINMIGLFIVGRYATLVYSRAEFFTIFFAAAIVGNVVSAVAHPFSVSVGASGAIFGLYGAVAAALFTKDKEILARVPPSNVMFILFQAVDGIIRGWHERFVDNWCHVGGAVTGVALGLLALYMPKGPAKLKRFAMITAVVTAAAAFLAMPLLVKDPYFDFYETTEIVVIESLRTELGNLALDFANKNEEFKKQSTMTKDYSDWINTSYLPRWQRLGEKAQSELKQFSNARIDHAKDQLQTVIRTCGEAYKTLGSVFDSPMNDPAKQNSPEARQLSEKIKTGLDGCRATMDDFVDTWSNSIANKF